MMDFGGLRCIFRIVAPAKLHLYRRPARAGLPLLLLASMAAMLAAPVPGLRASSEASQQGAERHESSSPESIQPDDATSCERSRASVVRIEPPVLDFGPVQADVEQRGHVKLVNLGSRPVPIAKVSASCGCTAVKPANDCLPANESVELQVAFTPRGPIGLVAQKRVTILLGTEPEQMRLSLPVRATISEFVRVSPQYVDGEDLDEVRFKLESLDKRPFRLNPGESQIFMEVDDGGDTPKPAHHLRINKARWREAGSPSRLVLDLDHPKVPHTIIAVRTEQRTRCCSRSPQERGEFARPADALKVLPRRIRPPDALSGAGIEVRLLLRGIPMDERIDALRLSPRWHALEAELVSSRRNASSLIVTLRLTVDPTLLLKSRIHDVPAETVIDVSIGSASGAVIVDLSRITHLNNSGTSTDAVSYQPERNQRLRSAICAPCTSVTAIAHLSIVRTCNPAIGATCHADLLPV